MTLQKLFVIISNIYLKQVDTDVLFDIFLIYFGTYVWRIFVRHTFYQFPDSLYISNLLLITCQYLLSYNKYYYSNSRLAGFSQIIFVCCIIYNNYNSDLKKWKCTKYSAFDSEINVILRKKTQVSPYLKVRNRLSLYLTFVN